MEGKDKRKKKKRKTTADKPDNTILRKYIDKRRETQKIPGMGQTIPTKQNLLK